MRINNTETFILKSKQIHSGIYHYGFCIYSDSKSKLLVTCNKHGNFKVSPNNHIFKKSGCPECKKKTNINKEKFINLSKKLFGNVYLYKNYRNNRNLMDIYCPIHKWFKQSPQNHIKAGCPKCNKEKMTIIKEERFIKKVNIIHNNFYSYDKFKYVNNYTKSIIICPLHGEFKQEPKVHIKHGCSKCSTSKGESKIIKYLKKNNIKYNYQHRYNGCKNIYTLPFDFYIPKYNLLIEYNGIQHYKEVDIFGGKSYLESVIINDNIKKEYCKNKRIKLLTIPYYFYNNIENHLNYLLF